MRIRTAIVFVVLGTCLFINLFMSSASSRTLQEGSVRWGVPVDGLQMSISAVGSNNLDNPKFEVVMRNAGERDVTLNLGYMLGNGKVQLPQNISLNVSDALGRTRKLEFFDRRYPAVAGRLDDYIVPLRAGSSYTLAKSQSVLVARHKRVWVEVVSGKESHHGSVRRRRREDKQLGCARAQVNAFLVG